jgi:iron complex outermembrane receptor protein
VKGEFLNKRLSLNVAYFDIKQSNNTVPSFPSDPANPRVLIPGVISRGFDGDVSFQVSRNFYFMGSFSLYHAKSVLGPAAAGFVQPYYNRIIKGSIPVINTAEQAASLYGVYNLGEGRWKGLSLGLGGNYLSKRAVTDGANQVMWGYVPGRTLIQSNINYRVGQRWKYSLNVDNLLNKKYIFSVRNQNVIIPGPPTNLKFSATYSL